MICWVIETTLPHRATERAGMCSSIKSANEIFSPISFYLAYAGIAQLVEQLICNQQVVGSNPTAGFLKRRSSGLLLPVDVEWLPLNFVE
jgi:hypothetical protein